MDRLPPELLTKIVDHTGTDDDHGCRRELKGIRFLTRSLSNIATARLFRTLPLWISQQSLQNLKDVSEHPQM